MEEESKAPAMPHGFAADYQGPYCFYKCLRDRHERSPLYLDRNIRRAERSKLLGSAHKRHQAVRMEISAPLSGSAIYVHVSQNDQHSFVVRSGLQVAAIHQGVAHLQIGSWLERVGSSKQYAACVMLIVAPNLQPGDVSHSLLDTDEPISAKALLKCVAQAAAVTGRLVAWHIIDFLSWQPSGCGDQQARPTSASRAPSQTIKTPSSSRKRKHVPDEPNVAVALIGASQNIELTAVQVVANVSGAKKNATPQRMLRLVITDADWVTHGGAAADGPKYTQSDITKLYVHYLFKDQVHGTDGMNSLVEMHAGLECSWCGCRRSSAQTLLQHLRCNHYHFKYEVTFDQQHNLHIVVRRDAEANASKRELHAGKFAAFAYASDHYGSFATPSREQEVERIPCVIVSHRQDATQCYAPGELRVIPARQTYHVRTGTATIPTEYDYDSDADVDKTWGLLLSEKLIDEFEDVSSEEKEFMKLWNRHLNSTIVIADAHLADACELFARRFAPSLLEKNLRHNFLLHLITLWDFSLLSGDDVTRCMGILDSAFSMSRPAAR